MTIVDGARLVDPTRAWHYAINSRIACTSGAGASRDRKCGATGSTRRS